MPIAYFPDLAAVIVIQAAQKAASHRSDVRLVSTHSPVRGWEPNVPEVIKAERTRDGGSHQGETSVNQPPMSMERRNRARLLIADDHVLLAEACKSLLEPEFEVVGIVANGRALLDAASDLNPHIVILDIGMPQLNGLDAGQQLKQTMPTVKLVYLTMSVEAEVAAEAFRRGASGYVLKSSGAEELTAAIRHVLKGESYLSPSITKGTVRQLLKDTQSYQEKRVTVRQSEVLQLLAEGKSMKEIAGVLNLKPGTVAFHKYRLMESLGLKTNAELLRYAIKHYMV